MLTVFSSRTCRASSSGSGGTSMAVLMLGRSGDRHLGIGHAEVARVGDDARQRRGGRGLRAAQEHAVLARAGAAREVARHRAQAVAARRPAPAPCRCSRCSRPGGCARRRWTRSPQQPLRDQVLEHLARGRVDVEGHAVVDLPAADHVRGDREVAVAGVGRGADVGLVDVLARDLAHRHHVAGARGLRDQRLDPREVDLLVQVVARRRRRRGSPPSPPSRPSLAQETAGRLVGGEDGGGRAHLGAHVGDDVAVHRAQALEAGAVVLDDPAEAALHAVPPQHLQDHVLGAGPRGAGGR